MKCALCSLGISLFLSVSEITGHLAGTTTPWCNTIHNLTNQERDDAICLLSYVTKAATLHLFTFTMSNYNYYMATDTDRLSCNLIG